MQNMKVIKKQLVAKSNAPLVEKLVCTCGIEYSLKEEELTHFDEEVECFTLKHPVLEDGVRPEGEFFALTKTNEEMALHDLNPIISLWRNLYRLSKKTMVICYLNQIMSFKES